MVTHNYAKWIDELDQQYLYSDSIAVYSSELDQLSHNLGEWVALTPDMMTTVVVPTEHYNNNNTTTTIVPETDETPDMSASTTVEESADVTSPEAPNSSFLSWADEMCNEDLLLYEGEEKNVVATTANAAKPSSTTTSTSMTENMTVKSVGEGSKSGRRKKKNKKR